MSTYSEPAACRVPRRAQRSFRTTSVVLLVLTLLVGCRGEPTAAAAAPPSATPPSATVHPLPSWNEGASKRAIVDFVARVTKPGSSFVAVPERIAVFDNDGTLWTEQPMHVQLAFALDRVAELAPKHPEWKRTQPFEAALKRDVHAVAASGEPGLMALLAETHTGNTTAEFEAIVSRWIAGARHPRFRRPYTALVYQPMLELLGYLRANGFKTFIVTGGGAEFVRPWSERVYGIPPEQVVGSRGKLKYESRDGKPALLRLPAVDLIDDGPGKVVGIQQLIGRRPIAAFGNSDGDFEMLEWTTSAPGPRLGLLVHHTDATREWAYDRKSHVGKLSRGLDEAPKRGWTVVDMKRDWRVIYPLSGLDDLLDASRKETTP